MQARASVSYITGSHAMKVGIQNDFGTLEQQQLDNEQGLFYTFNNGVPISIQQHALPFTQTTHLSLDMGIYAQDKWTFKRATINAGVRLDLFKNNFPEQHLGPAPFTPTRNVMVPGNAVRQPEGHHARVSGWPTICSATAGRRSRAAGAST